MAVTRIYGPVVASGDVDVAGEVTLTNVVIVFSGLPTSDPAVAGQLWNDAGALKVSAG